MSTLKADDPNLKRLVDIILHCPERLPTDFRLANLDLINGIRRTAREQERGIWSLLGKEEWTSDVSIPFFRTFGKKRTRFYQVCQPNTPPVWIMDSTRVSSHLRTYQGARPPKLLKSALPSELRAHFENQCEVQRRRAAFRPVPKKKYGALDPPSSMEAAIEEEEMISDEKSVVLDYFENYDGPEPAPLRTAAAKDRVGQGGLRVLTNLLLGVAPSVMPDVNLYVNPDGSSIVNKPNLRLVFATVAQLAAEVGAQVGLEDSDIPILPSFDVKEIPQSTENVRPPLWESLPGQIHPGENPITVDVQKELEDLVARVKNSMKEEHWEQACREAKLMLACRRRDAKQTDSILTYDLIVENTVTVHQLLLVLAKDGLPGEVALKLLLRLASVVSVSGFSSCPSDMLLVLAGVSFRGQMEVRQPDFDGDVLAQLQALKNVYDLGVGGLIARILIRGDVWYPRPERTGNVNTASFSPSLKSVSSSRPSLDHKSSSSTPKALRSQRPTSQKQAPHLKFTASQLTTEQK